jgi:hypothetical protein
MQTKSWREKAECRCGSKDLELTGHFKAYENSDENGNGIGLWWQGYEYTCNICGGEGRYIEDEARGLSEAE